MPERLHPGVYVEEVSGGVRPIEGVGTSTAAFVGETARGIPGEAQFLTGFAEFERAFGGHQPGEAGLLAQAVDAFFAAGGKRAYAVRVLPADAEHGVSSAQPARAGGGVNSLSFRARGAGEWSDNLRIHLSDSTNFPTEAFRVEVLWTEAGSSRRLELFDDVRMDLESEDYVADRINGISKYIEVVDEFAKAVDTLPAGGVLIPAQEPVLKAAILSGGAKYTLYDGTKLQVSFTDASQPNAPRQTLDIHITPALITAAFPSPATPPAFVNGKLQVTPAQLKTILQQAVTAGGGGSTFTITGAASGTDSPEIRVVVAKAASLDIAPPGVATTFNLNGETLTVTVGPPGSTTNVPITVTAASMTAVTPAELRASLAASLGGLVSSVSVTGTTVTITAHATEAGTVTISAASAPTATAISTTPHAGTAGLPPERFDGLQLSISEVLQPTVSPVLRQLGFAPRARGYQDNSPANPLARPASTTASTPVRLTGGSDGSAALTVSDFTGDPKERTGLHALDGIDVNLVALPGKNDAAYIAAGMAYCDDRGDCFFLADGPGGVDKDFTVSPDDAKQFIEGLPTRSKNAAMFYPWVRVADPVGVGRNPTRLVPPSGHVAGIFARTDITRGVWKAPAGIEATVSEALGLQYPVIDEEQDLLNPVSLNCLRQFPGVGIVSWGTRTLSPDPEWRYVPVRRTALFLMESLKRGLRWAVFEPNDAELWGRIRINIQSFMLSLFRQGAFQGSTPDEAFQVICDSSTNPQENIDAGIVTARVAFAPLKPAEFVVIQVSQKSLLVA